MTAIPKVRGPRASNRPSFCPLRLAVLGVLATLLPLTAFAQGYGRITGVVTDPTGAVVPGATVTVTRVGTGEAATTTTGSAGTYV